MCASMEYNSLKKRPKAKVQNRLKQGTYYTWAGDLSLNWVSLIKFHVFVLMDGFGLGASYELDKIRFTLTISH